MTFFMNFDEMTGKIKMASDSDKEYSSSELNYESSSDSESSIESFGTSESLESDSGDDCASKPKESKASGSKNSNTKGPTEKLL